MSCLPQHNVSNKGNILSKSRSYSSIYVSQHTAKEFVIIIINNNENVVAHHKMQMQKRTLLSNRETRDKISVSSKYPRI